MIWWWLFSAVVGSIWGVVQWLALHYVGLAMLDEGESGE